MIAPVFYTVLLSIETVETTLPPEMIFGAYRYSLGQRTIETADTLATFADVADGKYAASCTAITPEGVAFGPVVTADITVGGPTPTGTYLAPKGLSAAVG